MSRHHPRARVWRLRPPWVDAVACGLFIALALPSCAADRGTIGAVLAQDRDRRLRVHEVPAGLGADQAGVQPGDELLLIEGRDVRGMTPEQVHRELAGEVGEPVKLTLIRADRVVRVTLRRSAARPHRMSGGQIAVPDP